MNISFEERLRKHRERVQICSDPDLSVDERSVLMGTQRRNYYIQLRQSLMFLAAYTDDEVELPEVSTSQFIQQKKVLEVINGNTLEDAAKKLGVALTTVASKKSAAETFVKAYEKYPDRVVPDPAPSESAPSRALVPAKPRNPLSKALQEETSWAPPYGVVWFKDGGMAVLEGAQWHTLYQGRLYPVPSTSDLFKSRAVRKASYALDPVTDDTLKTS